MRKTFLCLFVYLSAAAMAGSSLAQNFDSMRQGAEESPAQPVVASTGECGDDPRLETDLITIMESNEPVKPLLTITPESFINLDPEVAAALGGKIVICPNIAVLKNGKPMKKVSMDFEMIWDNIRKATIAGDDEKVKQLLTSYTARPKTTQEIVNMLSPVNLDEQTMGKLYKLAGIQLPKEAEFAQVIDFYKALGGKTSDKEFVVCHFYVINDKEFKDKFGDAIDYKTKHPSIAENAYSKLISVGVNAVSK